MDFLNNINTETLIITSSERKLAIYSEPVLAPIKCMTPSEFIEKYYFTYNEHAVLYIMANYKVIYEVAKIYLKNIYYIDETIKYKYEKLNFLAKLKQELKENKLLITNPSFKEYLKKVDIIIYDVRVDNFLKKTLTNFSYEVINCPEFNYQHPIYEFETMEDEIDYVISDICEKISSGIDINHIKLANVDKSYYNTIACSAALHGLKVNIPITCPLSTAPVVRKFIKDYQDTDLLTALDKADKTLEHYDEMVTIINRYLPYDNKDLIIYKLQNTALAGTKYTNAIDLVECPSHINDEDYLYLIGFNDGLIPKYYHDTEYLTDKEKEVLSLEVTNERNEILQKDIIKMIHNTKNLTITYKLKDTRINYYPSTLCTNFKVEKGILSNKYSYSETASQLKLGKYYDEYLKFGTINKNLALFNKYFKINYNSYNNKYTKINRQMDSLKLSYSKLKIYNNCAFRYYLSEILKLEVYEENFSAIIGQMVHYVMEKCLSNNNECIEEYVSDFLKDKTLTKKESFFIDKYKSAIKELLNQVILEKEYSHLDNALYEEKIVIDYGNNISFSGIIDKVLYHSENDKTYLALVDYKTGADDISLKYFKYGIDIQLPIYLYLSTKLNFKNVIYSGFYLQKFNIDTKDYRLVGYSNSNPETLKMIDNNYEFSKIIKGMKTNTDGSFSKNSKIISDEEINRVVSYTENHIKEVIDKIKDNQFSINPKVSSNKNIGCEYCRFKDICFKTKSDEVEIFPEKFGGDNL